MSHTNQPGFGAETHTSHPHPKPSTPAVSPTDAAALIKLGRVSAKGNSRGGKEEDGERTEKGGIQDESGSADPGLPSPIVGTMAWTEPSEGRSDAVIRRLNLSVLDSSPY